MRPLLLAPALLLMLHAGAQCCCADHWVEVHATEPVHSGGKWNYSAKLNGDVNHYWTQDSVRGDPFTLRLSMPTGCGIEHAIWDLQREGTGQHMVVHLYQLPGDSYLPAIRLPWTPYTTIHFDLRDVLACDGSGSQGGKYHTKELICRTGRVRYTFDEGRLVRFEPLDMMPWYKEPPSRIRYTATQEARYLDGSDGMQQYLDQQVDKLLIEPLPGPVTFTGHAMVETNGMVNEVVLEHTPYPELEQAIQEALQRSDRWEPAVVERPSIPEGPRNFQAIRHTVPVRFIADPTDRWRILNEFELSIAPASPTIHDSLRLQFQWYAGSCGTYRDTVVISPPTPTRPWTRIAVGIGLEDIDCDDIVGRGRTVVLPPQPGGLYRVHLGTAPAGTSPIHPPDPFAYREIQVR